MGLFTQLLSFNGLARRLPTICKKSSQRTSNSDSRQKKHVLKNIRFSNYFMLAVFISLILFSKNVFAVWNFVRSLKFYYKNNFCPSLHAFRIDWIGLFYFKLNSRKWENSLCVFQRNSPKYSNDQRGKLHWNWVKFYGERNTGLHAITAPNYKQPNKLSQLQNTLLNLFTVTFLAILKWTEINLPWLIVDGCVKEGKWLTITVNF